MTLAMTHVGYVVAGWSIPLVAIAAYAWRTIRRSRELLDQVPPEERRWS